MRIAEKEILSAGDMSSEIETDLIDLPQQPMIGVQATWTGVPEGVLTLECIVENPETSDNWQVVKTVTLVGDPGSQIWDIWQTAIKKWRVHYVPDTGTGSLKVTYTASGV